MPSRSPTRDINYLSKDFESIKTDLIDYVKRHYPSDLQAEDRSIIANIADEIYNISSKEISGALYRQVLGEKLVNQQQQTYSLLKEVLITVQGFAQTTQVLLDAFIDHTHALPKIELNLEKEIKSKDLYRAPSRKIKQPDQIVTIPGKRIRIRTGTRYVEQTGRYAEMAKAMGMGLAPEEEAIYSWTNTPPSVINVKQPPKIIPGRLKTRRIKQKINFEAIIGGKENPRFTAAIQLDIEPEEAINQLFGVKETKTLTELGEKTSTVNDSLEKVMTSFENQQENLNALSLKIANFLSKHQFVN